MEAVEKTTISKVMWRLMPFLFICYFVAYLDRVNVGFAKLQMNAALGLSEAAYGLGAGLFFISYFLLEVPSNLALDRFGARLWIARIMFSWGLVSGMFAFIGPISAWTGLSTEWVFYILRFILGAAEAGFFPGHHLLPDALVPLGLPRPRGGAVHAGHPLLVDPRGAGLRRAAEPLGRRAARLAMAVHHRGDPLDPDGLRRGLLPDRPAGAGDLAQRRRSGPGCRRRLDAEHQQKQDAEHFGIVKALSDPRVLACAFVYFCLNAASYGVAFFLPTIVKGFGVSNVQTGFLAALPFVFGAVGMVLLGRNSDRTLKRREHVCFAMILAAVGVAGRGAGLLPLPGARPALPQPDRRLGDAAAALADPERLPDRHLGRGRHRRDQRARQPLGLRRAVHDGLPARRDRRLHRRAAGARAAAPWSAGWWR